jgi:hypothetical protein
VVNANTGAAKASPTRIAAASAKTPVQDGTAPVAAATAGARRALGDDAAAVHDHEPVAELLGLVHVVRGEHERHALLLQPVQPLPQHVPRLRVEPGGRLVEQQHLGLVDQRPRDREPALHAARERIDRESRGR